MQTDLLIWDDVCQKYGNPYVKQLLLELIIFFSLDKDTDQSVLEEN